MGEFSIFHWLVVLAIVLIFFGGRRIPEVMKGLGEGIRSFKDGMSGMSGVACARRRHRRNVSAPNGNYRKARARPGRASAGTPAAEQITTT